jgi:ABC-type transport system involved in cytochrome c biogenesis ATPase subunit
VALLGHATGLYDDLTVADNLHFVARAARITGASTVEDALARLGLAGRLAGVQVARLSAGQRRRVAVASLLLRPADLWLLDEPHAGLDADGRTRLEMLIAEASASGTTVLLASHELERARPLATRVVTMAGGQVVPAPGPSAGVASPKGVVGVA